MIILYRYRKTQGVLWQRCYTCTVLEFNCAPPVKMHKKNVSLNEAFTSLNLHPSWSLTSGVLFSICALPLMRVMVPEIGRCINIAILYLLIYIKIEMPTCTVKLHLTAYVIPFSVKERLNRVVKQFGRSYSGEY